MSQTSVIRRISCAVVIRGFVIPSCFGIRASSFLVLNHPSPDTPNLCMMREDMDAPGASTKKCAQNPADDTNDDRAPESTPKTIHVESDHDTGHEEQHQGIQDENEKAQRQQD